MGLFKKAGLLAFLVLSLADFSASLSATKIFGDGMVLQAAPDKAQVWGSLDGVDSEVKLNILCQSGLSADYVAQNAGNKWAVILDPVTEGDNCEIRINQEGQNELVIQDILFGDVWVCSGQSNMEWPIQSIFDAEQEIQDLAAFDKIRMFRPSHQTSNKPEDEFNAVGWPDFWFKTSDENNLRQFSAICLLYAKYLTETLGNKAFGLVESSWGGTRVEPWMTPEGLTECNVPAYENPNNPETSNSFIYNAMIHPILQFTIKGAIWYQGESNGEWNQALYGCTFPAMISEWRRKWSESSPTSSSFPFGFVQLAAWRENYVGCEFPAIRWHQTADMGYVPNELMENVFMAVSIDTFDRESGIHPRNKKLVTKRLTTAGLNVAYGQTSNPSNGPFPQSVTFILGAGKNTAVILFDQPIAFNVVEFGGFYVCCQEDYNLCDAYNAWVPADGEIEFNPDESNMLIVSYKTCATDSCPTGFAYLWNETPVLGTEALSIYGVSEHHLPAAPWKKQVAY